jgi:uncharacterized protein (DUF305 family)
VTKVRLAALAFVAALTLTACGDSGGPMGMGQNRMGFSSDDAMFAGMMIPHHEQAIVMSDLALEKSTDPDIRSLAYQIKAAQQPEIEQMKTWLDASSFTMPHGNHGMGMGGMLSEREMRELRQAQGADFDRRFLEGMIDHHEGAIAMARMVINSKNNEVRILAENIMRSQKEEIKQMQALLNR